MIEAGVDSPAKLLILIVQKADQQLMKVINKHILITISVLVSFGNFVFGFSLVSISMMENRISRENDLNGPEKDLQLSIITTLLPLGAFLGTFFTQFINKALGERRAMISLDVFGFLVLTYQAHHIGFHYLYATRFLLGLYLGVSTSILPSYLVSISPPQMTGLIGSFQQLLLTLGTCFAYRLGMSSSFDWRSYNQFPAYFCLMRIASLVYFKFDTLEKHYRNQEIQQLQKYVDLFYESGTVEELARIRQFSVAPAVTSETEVNPYKVKTQGFWGILDNMTSGSPIVVVMMALVLACANQLSGINAIICYAKQIFEHIVTPEEALENTYYLGVLQTVVTFISGFMINSYGRRSLMLVGELIIVVSLICAYLFGSLLFHNDKVIIAMIFMHVIGFSISLGPVTFIYAAEMMENLSFILVVNWILTILVSLLSEVMIKAIGVGKVFFFFGLCSLFCLCYLYHNMIESTGLSRQQLVAKYESGRGYRSLKGNKLNHHDSSDYKDSLDGTSES